jgi:hypothetical protein
VKSGSENRKLTFKLIKLTSLKETQILRMYNLMCDSYDNMSEIQFREDLQTKDYVGLLLNNLNEIYGFTTIKVNSVRIEGVNSIFSGDTIIDKNYWGKNNLVSGWVKAIGQISTLDTTKPWVWFLISKGHRTYMFLPIYFNQYYPSIDRDKGKELMPIIRSIAKKKYKNNWFEKEGILRFEKALGNMNDELCNDTFNSRNKHAKFFLTKNPGFYKGEELVCGTWINEDNLHPRIKNYFINGVHEGLKNV